MSTRISQLLIVDDEQLFRDRISRAFQDRQIRTIVASTIAEATTLLDAKPSHILLDLKLPDGTGLEFLPRIKTTLPDAKVVLLTGFGTIASAVAALKCGAHNYLTKPTNADAILEAFEVQESDFSSLSQATQTPTLEQVEWDHIQRVLISCGGNISNAAKALGMHRRSLQRKLAKDPGHLT